MLGKILRWELGMKSRNKKQRRKTGIARGTDRMREMAPWTVPPWEPSRAYGRARGEEGQPKMHRWLVRREMYRDVEG